MTINDKLDAISAIGPVEHFCTISQQMHVRHMKLKRYYNQVKNLIDPNSMSARYLNSYMTINEEYSDYKSIDWMANAYILASAFGYGCYVSDETISNTFFYLINLWISLEYCCLPYFQ